jgi:hypothetical protein
MSGGIAPPQKPVFHGKGLRQPPSGPVAQIIRNVSGVTVMTEQRVEHMGSLSAARDGPPVTSRPVAAGRL